MAKKKVYFFKIVLFDGAEIKDYKLTKNILNEIIEKYSKDNGKYRSIVLSNNEYDHVVMDIKEYKNDKFYARLSKQQPSNSVIIRDYETMEDNSIGIEDEREKGLEQYTYCGMDYSKGIYFIVSSKGAPTEKAFESLLKMYSEDYTVELVPVPNKDAIYNLYANDESIISKLEVEIPVPDPMILESILNIPSDKILELALSNKQSMKARVVISCNNRGKITEDGVATREIINAIKNRLNKFTKASIRGKTPSQKMRNYNFFDDNFSYEIEVKLYENYSGKRIYYSPDILFLNYINQMSGAYKQNKDYILRMTQRNGD